MRCMVNYRPQRDGGSALHTVSPLVGSENSLFDAAPRIHEASVCHPGEDKFKVRALQNRETRPGACDRDASLGGYRLASCHHRLRPSVPGACDYRVELHHSQKYRGPEGRTDILLLAAGMQCVLGAACITHDTLFDLADLPRIWAGSWP